MRRFVTIAMLCSLLPLAAQALSVPPLPPGMCALDEKNEHQQVIQDFLRKATPTGNSFVTGFASCEELQAIEAKRASSVTHFGSILTQELGESLPMDRKAYVDAAAASFSAASSSMMETALTDARASASDAAKEANISDPKSITAAGQKIIYKNDQMLIIGLTQTNNIDGRSVQVASVAALTLINGKPVSVNLYAPATDAHAFETSARVLQPVVMQLIAANL